MNICICDDDKYTHDVLKKYISCFTLANNQYEITDYYSGEELLSQFEKGANFDIFFLDIEMKNTNGIEAAKTVRGSDSNAIIIFISSHSEFVFDAFRVEALHFIVKPLKETEFTDVFNRAISKYNANHSAISVSWKNERTVIGINSILYIEGYNRHIIIHTKKGNYESVGKIGDILKTLEPHGFIQIHQGFIVNMNFIQSFNTSNVVLSEGTSVMMSSRKRLNALKCYDEFLQERKW